MKFRLTFPLARARLATYPSWSPPMPRSPTQYIEAIFRDKPQRRYTYKNDSDHRYRIGDFVTVTGPRGNPVTVEIVGLSDGPPTNLPTHVTLKDVLGLSEKDPS